MSHPAPITKEVTQPSVIETYGAPELYASGAVVKQATAGMVEVVMYVTRRLQERVEHHEVARVHMPLSGFDVALAGAISFWHATEAKH